MSNSYLMGAILDPLVNEFMSSAYKEGMLEAKIRTDEIRNNCPPRAGYVCVLDPRVKGGRYYRKQVQGEGINALPPSRIEKALAQQESRSQKGEGISFLGKVAIAGGLAVGGLAAIGAMANSGRSTEPVPDIPNTKKPDTSEKPKSSTYEEAKQAAFIAKTKPPVDNETSAILPRVAPKEKPKSADEIESGIKKGITENERIAKQAEAIAQKLETLKQELTSKPDNEPVPLTKTTQVSPDPEVTPVKKPKEKKSPVDITSMTAREASNTVIRDTYANIPDKAGAQNIGYKSAFQLKNELTKQGVIRDGAANSRADFEALLDNNMLVEEGLLVQTKTGVGKYGKNNIDAIRVPAFMPVKDLSKAASNIYSEGKGGAGITDRVERAEALVAAITEKLDKAKDLTELERNQLVSDRNRLTDKINVDNAKIKGSVIAEINKPMGKPKPEPPKVESVIAKKIVGADPKVIAQKLEKVEYINEVVNGVPFADAKPIADYLGGLKLKGAANLNRKAIVGRLNQKVLDPKAPAIAEKPPEDPNTFPLGASVPQAPVIRPEPAKPNYAAVQKEQRAIAAAERAAEKVNAPSTPKSSVDTPVNTPMEVSKSGEAIAPKTENQTPRAKLPERMTQKAFVAMGYKPSDAKSFVKEFKELNNDTAKLYRLAQMQEKVLSPIFQDEFLFSASKLMNKPVEELEEIVDKVSGSGFFERWQSVGAPQLVVRSPSDSWDKNLKQVGKMSAKEIDEALDLLSDGSYIPPVLAALRLTTLMTQRDDATKKQNNDAIASHETYYSAREQAKRDALRRFAA